MNLLQPFLLPPGASIERECFAQITWKGEKVHLRKPLQTEYGIFLASLYTVRNDFHEAGLSYFKPSLLSEWPAYKIETTEPSHPYDLTKEPYTVAHLQYGEYVHGSGPVYVVIADRMVDSMADNVDTWKGGSLSVNGFPEFLVLDVLGYPGRRPRSKNAKYMSLCEAFFQANHPTIKKDWLDFRSSYNQKKMEQIETYEELHQFVFFNESANFIDIKDSLTLENRMFKKWFSLLGEKDDKMAVLLLNRIIATCLFSSGVTYAIKRIEDRNGVHTPVIDYWSKDSVFNALKPYHYTVVKKASAEEEEEDNSETTGRKRKRRKTEEGGQKNIVYWFNVWLNHDLRAQVRSVIYDPWPINNPYCPPELFYDVYEPTRTLNTFYGYPVSFEDCKTCFVSPHGGLCVDLFRELIEDKFSGNKPEFYNFFHNWMAFAVQKPKEKTKVAVIIKSQQGMGKGFLSQILERWFSSNFFSLNGTTPDQKFNSFMYNKKMIWIDEVSAVFRDMNVMNSLITETSISIERKGIDQTTEVNLANFIGGTNHQIKLPLTTDSRRWFLLSAPILTDKELQSWRVKMRETWTAIIDHPQYGDSGVWAILYWYMTRDIENFIPMLSIPDTDDLLNCMEYTLHHVHQWWKDVLEGKTIDHNKFEPGFMIESIKFDWQELFNICYDPQSGRTKTGQAKRSLHLTEFKKQLENVAVFNIVNNQNGLPKIVFRPWPEQIRKWVDTYPKIKLLNLDISDLEPNPWTKEFITKITQTKVPLEVKEYTNQEKDYVITSLLKKLKEKGVETEFAPSMYKRKNSDNKDLLEFHD